MTVIHSNDFFCGPTRWPRPVTEAYSKRHSM